MKRSPDRFARKRARMSALSTVIGITLVLFMLGLLVLLMLNARKLGDYVKENVQVQVFLQEDAREADALQFKKVVDAEAYTLQADYISPEQAAEEMKSELGEDFIDFVGYNPLLPVVEVRVQAPWAHPDSLAKIDETLRQNTLVADVVYSKDLIERVNTNINRVGIVLLAFSALLLLIAVALINNTIRLSVYSKRLLIRSMQLVGATPWFIQRPFVGAGVVNGLLAGLIAIVLITGVIVLLQREIPQAFGLVDLEMFAKLFGAVLLLGIFISGLSTWFAVRRFLRMRPDQIF